MSWLGDDATVLGAAIGMTGKILEAAFGEFDKGTIVRLEDDCGRGYGRVKS